LIAPMPLGVVGARRVPSLIRLLRAERPSIFHAHLSWPLAAKYGLAAALAARAPAVIATVQLVPDFRLGHSSRLQLRALSLGIDRYVAVSRDIATRLAEDFGWPRQKIEVIYNAADLSRFPRQPVAAANAPIAGRAPVIFTGARLDPQKGHRVLLEALAALPGVVLALAGEGPERATLEARAVSLGIQDRVRFLGFRDDVPELLSACDVVALPSLYEGSSLSVLEAMAAERAIVSSDIAGTNELIEHGRSGLLVASGDATALAAALRRLLADDRLRASLGRCARERVEHAFTASAMAGAVERVYEQVLADA
jgi:glycosyltransferase involved in cell wall biosynthesis